MSKINSYFVGEEKDKIKILIELLDDEYGNLSSLYYELILKINGGKLDKRYYEIVSISEIYNIIDYLYENFNGNIKRRKLDDETGDVARFNAVYEEYRKSPKVTRERLYLEAMEDSPRINL